MGSFSLSGGVEVFGFISPSDTTDTYPVIDPLYGIDGLRNVDLLSDLNTIPTLRRRAGMVVGISGGTTYYKLNSPPWTLTLSDWSVFNSGGGGGVSGDYLPLSGGTVTGTTNFTSGLTSNTISATTYQNLPTDIRVTGGTFSNGTLTFTNNTGGTFNVTGVTSADTFTTAFTYSNNVFTINRNQNLPALTATINSVTGWTINGNLIVTGTSTLNGTISSTSLAGSTNRVVQVSSGGTISASADIISGYITSGGTAALLLENVSNWDINGNYTGSPITGTYQGQKHYDGNYFYEAIADNIFIRLIRG
jgi:hypothetical protein